MSDQLQPVSTGEHAHADGAFVWHPVYRGRTFQQVRDELKQDIDRDQRSYALAMDGAEGAEHDSLTTIVELERRWSTYEFDWAEMDPGALADRIVKFERARESRQESMSFADYRASGALIENATLVASEPERSLPIMKIGLAVLAILIIVFMIAIFA